MYIWGKSILEKVTTSAQALGKRTFLVYVLNCREAGKAGVERTRKMRPATREVMGRQVKENLTTEKGVQGPAASVSPEGWLEMQILRPRHKPRQFIHTWTFEKHVQPKGSC